MQTTRRDFGKLALSGGSAVALGSVVGMTSMGLSCGSVFADITSYVPIGIAAFNEVLSLVDPTLATTLAPLTQEVKAAFADLAAAVEEYNNAPAASKATLIGKITTAMNAVIDNLQKFWSDANLPAGSLASTIGGVLQIVISTLAAFLPLIGGAVAVSDKTKALAKTIPVVPRSKAQLKQKQFKTAINAVFVKYGYTGHQVY